MKRQKSEYEIQAEEFLSKTNKEIVSVLIGHDKYFDDDKETRDIYRIYINDKSPNAKIKELVSFKFGQSINNSGFSLSEGVRYGDKERMRRKPTAYDILASLTKYDVGSFSDFCNEFGYDSDSMNAHKTYFAVQEEWAMVQMIWSEELDELRKIN